MPEQSNTRRLAKNSLYMYIRMGLILIINLYSSRVILQNLGIEDYGIYNLVGSIIGVVSMIKGLFSSTTQRFMNYEMGRGDISKLRLIFSISTIVNIFIIILFVLLVEAIAFYFFSYKINISPDRMFAAKIVFQLSVLSSVLVILTSPYDSIIIARENFSFFAVVSVLDCVLRLIAILVLPFLPGDRLITYGLLILLVAVLMRITEGVYCSKKYEESHFEWKWDTKTFKSLISFAGWQLFGNSAYLITQNGINMVFNVYGGATVNAARGISMQIFSAVNQFLNNVNTVTSPYCIKAHASDDDSKMFRMFFFSSKVMYVVDFCLILPLVYLTKPIINIWLGVIPDYAVGFTQIVLLWSVFRSVHEPLDTLFKANGQLKYYQLTEGIIHILPLIFSYIILEINNNYYWALSTLIVFEIINWIFILLLLRKLVGLDLRQYFMEVIIPIIISLLFGGVGYYVCKILFASSICMPIIISVLIECMFLLFIYKYCLCEKERMALKSLR